ncbi:MAG: 1-acyl-sn-glycerol-3-phosphate acyltransferase [Anaerolineales bacterium]|jgi:SAM-dependent methyltransferase
MNVQPANVSTLTKEITIEILNAFSLPKGEFWQNTVGSIFGKPARRFSEIFAKFDQDIAAYGITEAAKRLLPYFVESSRAIGIENVPKEGPLVIASNHPGVVDGVSIIANLHRKDIKVIVGGMPFLQKLPVARNFTIHTVKNNDAIRANVVRSAIRHLKEGGTLLIFPSGQIDPDPAVLPGAREALENWSKSIAIMLRHVPETQFLNAITSGVLHEKFTHTPLTFLKKDGVGKRRIMEMIQVMRQMVFREKLGLVPLVTFDRSFTLHDLGIEGRKDAERIWKEIVQRAKILLDTHVTFLEPSITLDRTQHAG